MVGAGAYGYFLSSGRLTAQIQLTYMSCWTNLAQKYPRTDVCITHFQSDVCYKIQKIRLLRSEIEKQPWVPIQCSTRTRKIDIVPAVLCKEQIALVAPRGFLQIDPNVVQCEDEKSLECWTLGVALVEVRIISVMTHTMQFRTREDHFQGP